MVASAKCIPLRMATTPTPPLIRWKYNNWRLQSTTTEQLEQLKLHIQEVEGFVLESTSKGHSLRLQEKYLDRLEQHTAELERKLMVSQLGLRLGQVSSFERGSGA